jgi:hypothetical protein
MHNISKDERFNNLNKIFGILRSKVPPESLNELQNLLNDDMCSLLYNVQKSLNVLNRMTDQDKRDVFDKINFRVSNTISNEKTKTDADAKADAKKAAKKATRDARDARDSERASKRLLEGPPREYIPSISNSYQTIKKILKGELTDSQTNSYLEAYIVGVCALHEEIHKNPGNPSNAYNVALEKSGLDDKTFKIMLGLSSPTILGSDLTLLGIGISLGIGTIAAATGAAITAGSIALGVGAPLYGFVYMPIKTVWDEYQKEQIRKVEKQMEFDNEFDTELPISIAINNMINEEIKEKGKQAMIIQQQMIEKQEKINEEEETRQIQEAIQQIKRERNNKTKTQLQAVIVNLKALETPPDIISVYQKQLDELNNPSKTPSTITGATDVLSKRVEERKAASGVDKVTTGQVAQRKAAQSLEARGGDNPGITLKPKDKGSGTKGQASQINLTSPIGSSLNSLNKPGAGV